jgi:hypothetical protein
VNAAGVPPLPGDDDAEEPASPALRLRDFVPVELREASVARARPGTPTRITSGRSAEAQPAAGPPPEEPERVTLFAEGDL